jgi:hypothetical protein
MVNYVAVLVTAILGFLLGMLWYSKPLFGAQWMKLVGMTDKDMKKSKEKGMAGQMVAGFVTLLVMMYVLAWLVGMLGVTTFWAGLVTGFWVWLGFLGTTQLGPTLWQGKPFTLYLLNTSHYLVILAINSGILAVWV